MTPASLAPLVLEAIHAFADLLAAGALVTVDLIATEPASFPSGCDQETPDDVGDGA